MAQPAAHTIQHYKALVVALREYLEYVSQALILWPTPTRGRKKRTLQQTQAPAADLQSGMQSGREVLDSRGAAGLSTQGTATPPPDNPAQPSAASSSAGEGIPTSSSAARDSFARPAAASHSHSQPDLGSIAEHCEQPTAVSTSDSRPAQSGSISHHSAATSGVRQAPPSRSNAVPPPVPDAQSQPSHRSVTHTWSEARLGGRWICTVCLRTSRLQNPPRERCPGLSRKLQELVDNRQNHNLACCDFPSGILVFCTKCGCQTEGTRLAGLASICPRTPQSGKTGRNLSRIQDLMHPNPAKFGDQPVLSQPQSLDSLI